MNERYIACVCLITTSKYGDIFKPSCAVSGSVLTSVISGSSVWLLGIDLWEDGGRKPGCPAALMIVVPGLRYTCCWHTLHVWVCGKAMVAAVPELGPQAVKMTVLQYRFRQAGYTSGIIKYHLMFSLSQYCTHIREAQTRMYTKEIMTPRLITLLRTGRSSLPQLYLGAPKILPNETKNMHTIQMLYRSLYTNKRPTS